MYIADIKFKNVAAIVKKLKFTNAGHVARDQEDKWSKILTTWVPHKGRRGRGRPTTRWGDELKKTFGPNWCNKAKNRKTWKTLVAAHTQKWVTEGDAGGGEPPLT